MNPLITTSNNHPSRKRQTRQTWEIWTLILQDRTTRGHCVIISHAARFQIIQGKSQGWEQAGTNTSEYTSWTYAIVPTTVDEGSTFRYSNCDTNLWLSLWSAEPMRGSEKQLVNKAETSMKPRPKKHAPTSQKKIARLDSSDLPSSHWNCEKNTAAQFNNPT